MSKIRELFCSPHIQIALVTGASIVVMAYFSRRVLAEPISYLGLAIPPFIATLYELLSAKKEFRFGTVWYWIWAIIAATALVILLSWN